MWHRQQYYQCVKYYYMKRSPEAWNKKMSIDEHSHSTQHEWNQWYSNGQVKPLKTKMNCSHFFTISNLDTAAKIWEKSWCYKVFFLQWYGSSDIYSIVAQEHWYRMSLLIGWAGKTAIRRYSNTSPLDWKPLLFAPKLQQGPTGMSTSRLMLVNNISNLMKTHGPATWGEASGHRSEELVVVA